MTTGYVSFAGVDVMLPGDWVDVTDDLAEGSPYTLAKSESGIGALQFSVARYQSGPAPLFDLEKLRDLLNDFAKHHALGAPTNVHVEPGEPLVIRSDFRRGNEFIRVWYVTNGNDIALVTYVAQESQSPSLQGELREAGAIVRSIRYD
jgi:hypothetical protein